MLSRYMKDYEGLYQKWDSFAYDDNFENDNGEYNDNDMSVCK